MLTEADFVVKLGGSAITHKDVPFSADSPAIRRLAKELSSRSGRKVLLVYGGGSFGHAAAIKHLSGGIVQSPSGIAEIRAAMLRLTQELTSIFIEEGIPIFAVSTSSCFSYDRGSVRCGLATLKLVSKALDAGLIPAMGGDIIMDRAGGGRILSGDAIARTLALRFKAKTLAFGTDVDGVIGPGGVMRSISRRELPSIISKVGGRAGDVTGGMAGKLKEIRGFHAKGGYEVVIFNARKPGLLRKLLLGDAEGTVIK